MTGFPGAEADSSLAAALNVELGEDSPHLFAAPEGRPGLAFISDGRSKVNAITGNDAYALSFVRDNWGWAHGATQDRHQLAEAARAWLAGTGLEEMAARWTFVKFSELQLAYERGDELETQWRIIRSNPSELYQEVVELAAENPTVKKFFPGLGHNFLFMPHAFTHDILASIAVQTPGQFRLWAPGHPAPLAEGPPPTVITKLAELLESLED